MHRESLVLGCWAPVSAPGLALAQGLGERSIPDATELGSLAVSPGAKIRAIGIHASIGSYDSRPRAKMRSIEGTPNNTLVPIRNGEAPLLGAQRGRWAS